MQAPPHPNKHHPPLWLAQHTHRGEGGVREGSVLGHSGKQHGQHALEVHTLHAHRVGLQSWLLLR
eukprot:1162024-Pelagomonas_calceolata.AAC.1